MATSISTDQKDDDSTNCELLVIRYKNECESELSPLRYIPFHSKSFTSFLRSYFHIFSFLFLLSSTYPPTVIYASQTSFSQVMISGKAIRKFYSNGTIITCGTRYPVFNSILSLALIFKSACLPPCLHPCLPGSHVCNVSSNLTILHDTSTGRQQFRT